MLFLSTEARDRFLAGAADYTQNDDVNRWLNYSAWEMDLTPFMQTYTGPTLVLHGEEDFNIAMGVAFQIHEAAPHSLLVIMESCGHLPFYEKPEEFASLVRGFLNLNP